jgi:hypothetical protein
VYVIAYARPYDSSNVKVADLELTWDRPVEEWPRTPSGAFALISLPLDLETLTALS